MVCQCHSGLVYCIDYCSIDATEETGRYGRLINPSRREPNAKSKMFIVEDKPRLCIVALRDIEPGEEITFDYGETDPETIKGNPWLKNS